MTKAAIEIQDTTRWNTAAHLEQSLRDYVIIGSKLILQRQAIFLVALVLGIIYFDPTTAVICYLGVLSTEVMDIVLFRWIREWSDHSAVKARRYFYWVMINTALSTGAISLFVVMTALQQPPGAGHFTPMFFLFAAALFAAMNNHQILAALTFRLFIYGGTFIFISLMDVVLTMPPLTSEPWLQFFTSIFVLYFILDCSFQYLKLYRKNVRQMDELRLEHGRALQAYEVKSKFLSTVSHELRTPLTSIKASVDLINLGLVGTIPAKAAAILQTAGKNAKRLSDLIDDLLDVQKIEAGEMNYRFAPVNARALVLEAVDANRSLADQIGIGFECSFPATEFYVLGDDARLMQVMANLLSNALKFSTKNTRVAISVTCSAGKVRVAVTDNGVGISQDARDLVFGKFTQIDSSDQRRVGGTGLGMHISKQIVERHLGVIDYVSEVGKGTTFFVELAEVAAPSGAVQAAA